MYVIRLMDVIILKPCIWFNKSFIYMFPTDDFFLLLMFASGAGGRPREKMENKTNKNWQSKINTRE